MPELKKPPSQRMDLQVSCSKCQWMYSTRNNNCPMCGVPLLLDFDTLVRALQEYVELQGTWINKKEAKKFIESFKVKFKKLPDLDILWKTALKLSKLEEMSQEDIDKRKKIEKKKEQEEEDTVQKKMREIQQKKLAETKNEEEKKMKKKKKNKKKKKKKDLSGMAVQIACPKCNENNPSDSKFCLNCGFKLME